MKTRARQWIVHWSHRNERTPDPSPDVVAYFKRFRPKGKITVYRAEMYGWWIGHPDVKSDKFTSYTHDRELAQAMVDCDIEEGVPARVIKRTVPPSAVLVDVTLLPFAEEGINEVIVTRDGRSVDSVLGGTKGAS